jgi:hypothetical protein
LLDVIGRADPHRLAPMRIGAQQSRPEIGCTKPRISPADSDVMGSGFVWWGAPEHSLQLSEIS